MVNKHAQLMLPDPRLPEGFEYERTSDSYKGLIFSLLSEIINADGILTLFEFNTFKDALSHLLKESDLQNDNIRISAWEALLHPQGTPQKINHELKLSAEKNYLSAEAKVKLITQVLDILDSSYQADATGIGIAKSLIHSLDVFDEQITRQIKKLSGKTDFVEMQPTRLQHIGKKVVDFLKADIANFTFKKNIQEQQLGLITRLNRFNQRYTAAINQIMKVAQAIKDSVLVEEITAFQAQLQHQSFKVVLVGEIKHGKSSLFNAILRQEFSPTGESVATTASVVELSYSKHPQYEGVWMNEEEVNKIRKYIQENQNSLEYIPK